MIISLLEHTNMQLDRSSNISKKGLVMKLQLDDESLMVVYLWGNNTTKFSLMKKLDTLHNLKI